MAVDAASLSPPARQVGVAPRLRAIPAGAVVAVMVAVSAVVRMLAAVPHSTPRYFPDEYIYAELARSLADGRLQIRGEPARFPALLESLLTAPLWLVGGVETAFRLTQGLHAVVASLVAVPVYLLARRLSLPTWQCLASSALSLALPSLLFASYLTADVLGLTLAATAVYAAVVALDSASPRAQLAFLAAAGLATFSRVQYVVLVPAFAVGALAVMRLHPLAAARRFGVMTVVLGGGLIGMLALGPGRVLGYYSGVLEIGLEPGTMLHWARVDLMLLVYAAAVVLIPAAAVGLVLGVVRPAQRAERAFCAVTAALAAFLLIEAMLYAIGTERFQERYFIALGTLIPLLFFVGARHLDGRRARIAVAAGSLFLVVMAARSPLAGFTSRGGSQDSPTLQALAKLEELAGIANGSLVVSIAAASLALAAAAAAFRPRFGTVAVTVLAFGVLAVVSIAAVATDSRRTNGARSLFPENTRWVDEAELGEVSVLVTPGTLRAAVSSALFWNRSIVRVLQMRGTEVVDTFGFTGVTVRSDGTLLAAGRTVSGPVLVQEYASTTELDGGRLLRRDAGSSLWQPAGPIRIAAQTNGLYLDGWLSWPQTTVRVWPRADGPRTGVLCLDLRQPEGAGGTLLFAGPGVDRVESLRAGEQRVFGFPVTARRPWLLKIGAARPLSLGSRLVSALSERPRFVEGPVGPQGAEARCR
jgi:hypothetical protein